MSNDTERQPTVTELIAHRRTVTVADPRCRSGLAGPIPRLLRCDTAEVSASVLSGGRAITVRALVRPEPDLRLLVKAAIAIAEQDLEEEGRRAA